MRILWLKTELLHPVDKGGRIRTYNMLRELSREHEVVFLTLDADSTPEIVEKAYEYCGDLIRISHTTVRKFSPQFYLELLSNLASPLPYAVAHYRSPAMLDRLTAEVMATPPDVVVCDFLAASVNVPDALPVPTVLFQHNIEAEIWRRHADVAVDPLRKAYFRAQWRKMHRYEAAACRRFDRVVTVSDSDRELARRAYGVTRVDTIATGVDTAYFRPSHDVEVAPHNVVFTGSMDWLPNDDGMRFFLERVFPLVRRRIPDASLTIVGRRPSRALRKLAASDPAVEVTGRVEDVRAYMERAAAFVVPLRIGGGTRLKIFEAMAMEIPLVSTPVGMEGLPITENEELLVAEAPDAFADAVVRLLQDRDEAVRMAQRAAARVRRDFGWPAIATHFADICARTTRSARAAQNDELTGGNQCE